MRWLLALVTATAFGLMAGQAAGFPVDGGLVQAGVDDDLTVPAEVTDTEWQFHPTDDTKVVKFTATFGPSGGPVAQPYNITLRLLNGIGGELFENTLRGVLLSTFTTTDVQFNLGLGIAIADIGFFQITICEDLDLLTPPSRCGK